MSQLESGCSRVFPRRKTLPFTISDLAQVAHVARQSSQLAKAEKDLRSPKAFGRAAELAGNFLAGFLEKKCQAFLPSMKSLVGWNPYIYRDFWLGEPAGKWVFPGFSATENLTVYHL